jgi:hypothetical protein
MDRYIDNDETQTYGPKLRSNIDASFTDAAPEVTAFLAYLTNLQASADKRMADGMAKARGAKSPLADAAKKLLAGFHKHLGSKQDLEEWSGDIKLFFPKGLGGIGTAASDVATALATAKKGLEKDATVPDGKKFQKRLASSEKNLRTKIGKTGGAVKKAQAGLSEQSAEKKEWLAIYRGIALIVEGLLTLDKRPSAVRSIVPHLSVSGGKAKAKKAKPKPEASPPG